MTPAPLQASSASGILLVVLAAAVVAVLFASCAREVRERSLFFPRKHPMTPEEPGRRNVVLPYGDGRALRGWYLECEGCDTTLVFHYGNGETVLDNAPRLAWFRDTLEVNVLAVDYRGYGFSDGTPGVDALLEDSLRIYDYLRQELADDGHHVVVYGRSIGTVPAVHLAAERSVAGLILEAPFTNISDVIAAWRENLRPPFRWFIRLRPEPALAERRPQPEDLIAEFDQPLLVIHGEADRTIPPALGRAMYEVCPSADKTWVGVPNVDHNNLRISHPDVASALQAFFRERRGAGSTQGATAR